MDENERSARVRLSLVGGVGTRKYTSLIEEYGSALAFLNSTGQGKAEFCDIKSQQRIIKECNVIDMEAFYSGLKKKDIKYIVLGQDEYPLRLKHIDSPPSILYYKGSIKGIDFDKCISIVGTRTSTVYGKVVIDKFIMPLVDAGFCIVSGMAFGIDKYVHEKTLKSGGKTIAVLASSPDVASPYSNVKLYRKILKSGLILSENYPGIKIGPGMFPERNRIISGLSIATLVIEAGERSGALITALMARDQNRQVYATPGDITRFKSQGANDLIKKNIAQLVTSADDIFYDLRHMISFKNPGDRKIEEKIQLSSIESRILKRLKIEPMNEDKIIERFDINTQDLLASLSRLELEGAVKRRDDGCYIVVY